ncbi:MAG: CAAX amino terminal protease [Fusobacteria bacterium]|nr:MAG: CAAX amino terminal protease [Fusobacteriota bacterium]KAF0230137.1 MAG: CAAX amino terminal [Fusobacteriota bacterium]
MNKKWDISETFLGFAIYYLVFSLVDVIASNFNISKDNVFLISSIVSVITLFTILYLQISKGKGSTKKLETTSKNNSRDFLIGVISGITLGSIVVLSVFNDEMGIFSLLSIKYMRTFLYPNGIINMILFFIVFVIAIPIAAEMFFRGYMYPALEKHYNLIIAAFVTSIFSSIFLSGSISFLLLFIAGLVFAFLYQKTEAVFCSIVSHMTFNLIITLIIFIKGGN